MKMMNSLSYLATILFLFPNVTQTSLSQHKLPLNMQHESRDFMKRELKLKMDSLNGHGYIDAAIEVHSWDGTNEHRLHDFIMAFRSTRTTSLSRHTNKEHEVTP